jgi:hypothetical protein
MSISTKNKELLAIGTFFLILLLFNVSFRLFALSFTYDTNFAFLMDIVGIFIAIAIGSIIGKKYIGPTHNINKSGGRKFADIVIILVLTIGGFILWFSASGNTDEIISAANRFQPDSTWSYISSQATPPKTFCIDETCPSVSRTWSTQEPVNNVEQFQRVAVVNGVKMDILKECFYVVSVSHSGHDPTKSCDAHTVLNGYEYWLNYSGDEDPATFYLRVGLARL